jgi:hypothetical protein
MSRMAAWTRGDQMPHETKRDALRRYVHRHTLDHVYGGTPLQNITDTQWLAEHAFPLRSDGAIDERYTHCGPAFLAEGEATDG